eukprot:scaffold427359_cov45-Prasinocladus_malaysianus.AAC.1
MYAAVPSTSQHVLCMNGRFVVVKKLSSVSWCQAIQSNPTIGSFVLQSELISPGGHHLSARLKEILRLPEAPNRLSQAKSTAVHKHAIGSLPLHRLRARPPRGPLSCRGPSPCPCRGGRACGSSP